MTQTQVKEQLNALLDRLPPEQAELVLDFATLLRQRQSQLEKKVKTQENRLAIENVTDWETSLAEAERYWFQLPEAVRVQYTGSIIALLRTQILGADVDLKVLRRRIAEQYPEQPVLYMDANAEREPILIMRSPRLR